MVDNFKKYMPDHKPLWTCVQVEMLGEKEMDIEIEVIAHVPSV
jgi:enamine deaminase RidA (YjgF/YER057c/UK114 family)